MTPKSFAQLHHDTSERLAPEHGYMAPEAGPLPFEHLPEMRRNLMIATMEELMEAGKLPGVFSMDDDTLEGMPDRDKLYDGTGYGYADGEGKLFGVFGGTLAAEAREQIAIEPTHAAHMALAVGKLLQEDDPTALPDLVQRVAAECMSWKRSLNTYEGNKAPEGEPRQPRVRTVAELLRLDPDVIGLSLAGGSWDADLEDIAKAEASGTERPPRAQVLREVHARLVRIKGAEPKAAKWVKAQGHGWTLLVDDGPVVQLQAIVEEWNAKPVGKWRGRHSGLLGSWAGCMEAIGWWGGQHEVHVPPLAELVTAGPLAVHKGADDLIDGLASSRKAGDPEPKAHPLTAACLDRTCDDIHAKPPCDAVDCWRKMAGHISLEGLAALTGDAPGQLVGGETEGVEWRLSGDALRLDAGAVHSVAVAWPDGASTTAAWGFSNFAAPTLIAAVGEIIRRAATQGIEVPWPTELLKAFQEIEWHRMAPDWWELQIDAEPVVNITWDFMGAVARRLAPWGKALVACDDKDAAFEQVKAWGLERNVVVPDCPPEPDEDDPLAGWVEDGDGFSRGDLIVYRARGLAVTEPYAADKDPTSWPPLYGLHADPDDAKRAAHGRVTKHDLDWTQRLGEEFS